MIKYSGIFFMYRKTVFCTRRPTLTVWSSILHLFSKDYKMKRNVDWQALHFVHESPLYEHTTHLSLWQSPKITINKITKEKAYEIAKKAFLDLSKGYSFSIQFTHSTVKKAFGNLHLIFIWNIMTNSVSRLPRLFMMPTQGLAK